MFYISHSGVSFPGQTKRYITIHLYLDGNNLNSQDTNTYFPSFITRNYARLILCELDVIMIYSEVVLIIRIAAAQLTVLRRLTTKTNLGVNQSSNDITQGWISSSPSVWRLRILFTQTTEVKINEGTPSTTLTEHATAVCHMLAVPTVFLARPAATQHTGQVLVTFRPATVSVW